MPEDNEKNPSAQQQNGDYNANSSSGEAKGAQKNDEPKEEKKPMPRGKKALYTLTGIVAALILIAIGVLWLLHTSTYETTDDAQVDGHLNSIASRVNGTVIAVYAENNQPVKAGQLLIKLDPRDLQATAEQSKANYDQAVAKLAIDFPNVPIQQNTNAGTIDSDAAAVDNAKAALKGSQKDYEGKVSQLRQAEAANEKAQKDLVRYRQLMEKREIAPSDYDQYVANAQQNQATVDSNLHAVESAGMTVEERKAQLRQQQSKMQQDRANAPQQTAMKKSQLDSDKASIAAAKAQYDADMLNLSYTEIYSPIDGIASQRNAEIGSRVNASQQVMVVVQTQNQWVTANFKETQLKKMHPNQHVSIKIDAVGKNFTGSVENMPAATGDRNSLFPPENATGNYVKVVQRLPVRIRFDQNQNGLDMIRPGMSVETKVSF